MKSLKNLFKPKPTPKELVDMTLAYHELMGTALMWRDRLDQNLESYMCHNENTPKDIEQLRGYLNEIEITYRNVTAALGENKLREEVIREMYNVVEEIDMKTLRRVIEANTPKLKGFIRAMEHVVQCTKCDEGH